MIMNNKEIVLSYGYKKLLSDITNVEVKVDYSEQLRYYKYHSDKLNYQYDKSAHVVYEIIKKTVFFFELDNKTLIGLYNHTIDKDYIIKLNYNGELKFIGDSISNWTNEIFEQSIANRFQNSCYNQFQIPTRKSNQEYPDLRLIELNYDKQEYLDDKEYKSYLESDVYYNTYEFLKDNAYKNGLNKKNFQMMFYSVTDSRKEFLCFLIDPDNKKSGVQRVLLDSRFLDISKIDYYKIKPYKFLDLYIEYEVNDLKININKSRITFVSIFNLIGLFRNFKTRLVLIKSKLIVLKLIFIAKMLEMVHNIKS